MCMLLAGYLPSYTNKPMPRVIPEIKPQRYAREPDDVFTTTEPREPAPVVAIDDYREPDGRSCVACLGVATCGRHAFCSECWRRLPKGLRVDLLIARNAAIVARLRVEALRWLGR